MAGLSLVSLALGMQEELFLKDQWGDLKQIQAGKITGKLNLDTGKVKYFKAYT